MIPLSASKEQLTDSLGQLAAHWNSAKDVWNDAARQEQPRQQRPAADRVDPSGVELARDQRADRERERDGDARVAEVEHRRMDRHAGVLELRVQAAAVRRDEAEPRERVRGEHHHGDEERRDRADDARHVGHQFAVLAAVGEHRERAPRRDDDRPEQQRALLPGVERRPRVVDREVAAGVGGDVLDAEIVREQRAHQGARGHEQQAPHHVDGALGARGHLRPALETAHERDRAPPDTDEERDPECGGTEISQRLDGGRQTVDGRRHAACCFGAVA